MAGSNGNNANSASVEVEVEVEVEAELGKNENQRATPKCNCTKFPCPVLGKCQTRNVVYQATVRSENDEAT